MNYLNIHTDLLRSEEYLGAEPVERATWLNLMGWCASQENGGVIREAHEWTDRKWQQLCGVTLREIQTPSKLYFFKDGGNLVVWSYPADKEKEVKTNRKNGKRGGRPRKEETQKKPGGFESENQVVSNRETDLKTEWFEIAETEGKGREGNGKKSKEDVPTQTLVWSVTEGWAGITDQDLQDWKEAFPACDIKRQLALMTEWLKSNPAKAKKKQWRRFVTGWLSRSQERGGDIQSNRPEKPQPQRCL